MACIIGISLPVIEICSKRPKTDVPKTTELDLLDVFCADADVAFDISL